jgi:RNA polymerase sigma-70 factor (ECF subfamily)
MTIEEQALLKEAQRGSIPAFEALVRKYDRQVMQLALNMLGDVHDAEDIYQDIFVTLFRKLDSFDFRSEFSTWLFRVAVNACINSQKKRQRRKGRLHELTDSWQETLAAPEQTPEESALSRELGDEIERALDRLSGRQRAVFVMRYYQDYKLKEIADIMDCSLGTVKNYLFRATRKLQVVLHEYANI